MVESPSEGRAKARMVAPSSQVRRSAEVSPPSVIDMFSGAGGFSLGLVDAGLHVVLGSDCWSAAANTYRRNFNGHKFLEGDARDLAPQEVGNHFGGATGAQVVVGGPPCQGFSSAGARRVDDRRNTLVKVYSTLAASIQPDVVVFENVEGFLTADQGRFVVDLLDPLIEAGYQVSLRKVNVANYGVPQLRKRVIAIASLGRRPYEIAPTHRAFGAPGVARVGNPTMPATKTLAEALRGLPAPCPNPPGVPVHHLAAPVSDEDRRRIHALKPGQTMRDLPEELWHDSYRRRANRRVSDGTPTERRGGAPAGLRRLRADEPAKAITGAAVREFIHPDEDRPLTLRECARVQTFPDSFEFVGTRADMATMIGNAIPPSFAQAIGRAVLQTVARPQETSGSEGRLVHFDPTAADGVSPALASVIRLVRDRYRFHAGPERQKTVPEPLWA